MASSEAWQYVSANRTNSGLLECILPGLAVVSGKWQSVVTGHELVYLSGDRMLDWMPATGDFRLYKYVRK
jgi:hypothetical protein